MSGRRVGVLGRLARRFLGTRASPPAAPSRAVAAPPPPLEPDSDELPLEVEEPPPGSFLLDCREPREFAGGVVRGALLLPMDMVPHHLAELPRDRPITVYCAAGARSAGVAHWLREQGLPLAVSLGGGIGALRFQGREIVVPSGVPPGTRVIVPADTTVDGARLGVDCDGEVIEAVDDTLVIRVTDTSGYQVRVRLPRARVLGL